MITISKSKSSGEEINLFSQRDKAEKKKQKGQTRTEFYMEQKYN